jgi:uncharacterized protein with FMN-binding domain
VRRGSALVVVTASCAALLGAWRLGDESRSSASASSASSAHVLAPPQIVGTTPSTTGSAGNPTSSTSPTSRRTTSTRISVDGAVVSTRYGDVQVRAVVTGGKLTDVVALHLTDQGQRSVSISAGAAPVLRREALAAGSAKIDSVSGASYTSAGYIQSLQSALDAARAAG